MNEELTYSIHLGSDKNRTNKAKEIAKTNPSGTTSFSNNAIQNAKQLSDANKHNLRDYDKNRDDIFVIYGSNNLFNDVRDLYLQEFEQAKNEYNEKQTREDRKIKDYFNKISQDSQRDLACEIIIELGDMDFWKDKDMRYKKRMSDVYNEQVKDLMKVVPEFKVANAVIHYDETSPHMHIIGVPIKDNYKKGMKKQVAKSQIFTKSSLKVIQDEMRKCCIKSYNKFYEKNSELKKKQKGRNRDIPVDGMTDYREVKKQYEKKEKKLAEANKQTNKLDNTTKDINQILNNLKPAKFNKNNMVISNEDVEKIKNFAKDVNATTKTVRSVNDLNMAIKDFEYSSFEMAKENRSLKYQIELNNDEIINLKRELSTKEKIISKLQIEKEKLKTELQKFKGFWHRLIKQFQNKIGFDKDEKYKYVSDDLYRNGIFDDNDNRIVNDILRKIKPADELNNTNIKKKNNMELK